MGLLRPESQRTPKQLDPPSPCGMAAAPLPSGGRGETRRTLSRDCKAGEGEGSLRAAHSCSTNTFTSRGVTNTWLSIVMPNVR